jgi:NAD(P) transhydrogenase
MIGFPALAPISMEQGRLVTYPAFGAKTQSVPERFPYDIYAVSEISMVGKNEEG